MHKKLHHENNLFTFLSLFQIVFIFGQTKSTHLFYSIEEALNNKQIATSLCLSGNNFNKNLLPKIGELKNLEYFQCTHTNLSTLPKELAQCKKLEVVKLSKNNFSNFPKVLTQIPSLKEIYIGNNSIKTLPHEVSNLNNLEFLDIHGNAFNEFPNITLLQNIKHLWIGSNKFNNIPKEISDLQKLEVLKLGDAMHDDVCLLTSINVLPVTKLPSSLLDCKKLKKLDLEGVPVTHIPEGFFKKLQIDYSKKYNHFDSETKKLLSKYKWSDSCSKYYKKNCKKEQTIKIYRTIPSEEAKKHFYHDSPTDKELL